MATIQGKITYALEPRTGQNARGAWMVQEFVLESYDQPYPRHCVFSVFGEDRLKQFNIKAGDDVAVDIDIDAREYNGRFYNSVRAWRVVHITAPQPSVAPGYGAQPASPAGYGMQPAPAAGYGSQAASPAGYGAPQPPASPAGYSAPQSAPMAPPPAPADDPLQGDTSDDLPF